MQKPETSAVHRVLLADSLGRLASALKFSTIAVVAVVLYLQDLSIVFNNALHDEAYFHILAVPFLFAFLLYRKRKMIRATVQFRESNGFWQTRHFQTLIGVLLSTTAVIAYWYGSYTFTPLEYHLMTLPVFVAGLVLILFNVQALRQLAFPIGFLLFLTPPPVEILYGLGSALSNFSAAASNALVNAFRMTSAISTDYGSPIIVLTRPDKTVMSFTVDVACSGVYSLIGFVIFAVFIAYISRSSFRSKPAILLLGVPLIIGLNIVRITTVLALGYFYGDQLALQVFHLVGATVLMFIGTLLLLAITEKAFNKPFSRHLGSNCDSHPLSQAEDSCPQCGKLLRVPRGKLLRKDIGKIAAVALAIIFLLTIQAPVFALTQGPAQVVIQTPSGPQGNTQILPQIQGYNLSYIYRDIDFEKLVGEDASLVYAYSSTDPSKATVWIAVEVAPTLAALHRWETCLITFPISQGYQPKITQLDLKDIQTLANPPIIARYFAFQYHSTNQTQLVLYWYETATFITNNTSVQKHVKMSVVTYPVSPRNISEAETELVPFAQAINEYWQPIKSWTQIALTISQNGLILSASTAGLLVVVLLYWTLLNWQDTLSLLLLYGKLPEQNRLIIQAVRNASKTSRPTTANIAHQLTELTKNPASVDKLTGKLEDAANVGLLKKSIDNGADEPLVTWRNRVPETGFMGGRYVSKFFSPSFLKVFSHKVGKQAKMN